MNISQIIEVLPLHVFNNLRDSTHRPIPANGADGVRGVRVIRCFPKSYTLPIASGPSWQSLGILCLLSQRGRT